MEGTSLKIMVHHHRENCYSSNSSTVVESEYNNYKQDSEVPPGIDPHS